MVALLDELFSVVPRSSRVVEHHGEREAGCEAAAQKTYYARDSEEQTYADRDDNGQDGWQDHLMLSAFCGDLHAASVVRRAFPIHDARNLTELAPDLIHHL